MTKFYVYEHWRSDTNQCFYVGKGHDLRAYKMRRRNKYHSNICKKVISDGGSIEVRFFATELSENDAYDCEMKRISFWLSAGVALSNMTSGGEGLKNPTEETRQKISKSNIGNKKHFGYKHSPETRAKMSAASKLRWSAPGARKRHGEVTSIGMQAPEIRNKCRSRLGIKHTEEHKRYMSNILKGRPRKVSQ